MDLTPIADRIIVRREVSDEKTAGGILLPDTAKKKPQRGTILAVGPGKLNLKDGSRMPMTLKVGDTVLFTSWAGDEFKDNKKAGEVLVMHESDVMAVVG
jgi:chaperonin GroES